MYRDRAPLAGSEAADHMKLTIQVTKTANGQQEYMQIMSDDMFSINVVLIADKIEIRDDRPDGETP